MTWRDWNDDDALMADLGDAVRRPEVSERVLLAARNALAWRNVRHQVDDLDLELGFAELRYDSVLDDALAVRSGPGDHTPRTLAFSGGEGLADDLGVEIEIGDRGIVGQLVPPGPGEVRLVGADGPIATATADEIGRFAFATLPRGPIRLQCSSGQRSFVTEWVPV